MCTGISPRAQRKPGWAVRFDRQYTGWTTVRTPKLYAFFWCVKSLGGYDLIHRRQRIKWSVGITPVKTCWFSVRKSQFRYAGVVFCMTRLNHHVVVRKCKNCAVLSTQEVRLTSKQEETSPAAGNRMRSKPSTLMSEKFTDLEIEFRSTALPVLDFVEIFEVAKEKLTNHRFMVWVYLRKT